MTFDLTTLADRIRKHEAEWASLVLNWTYREVSPNYGKPTTSARFESISWLGEISIWATGETELETFRTGDSYGVNKLYDLIDEAQVEEVLTDLIGLLRDGVVPLDAFTYSLP